MYQQQSIAQMTITKVIILHGGVGSWEFSRLVCASELGFD
jgi:hypothetical protein